MPAAGSAEVLETLKGLQWATPLKKLSIPLSKVGKRGWYQVTEEIFISTVSHNPRSGNYLDDPNGPFVLQLVWIRCPDAISVLMGDVNTVNCKTGPTPPAVLLPPGARGTFESIVNGFGAGNYWERLAYTADDKFKYRMIADPAEAYTYYFSCEVIADDELPFAAVYLLENGRIRS